MTAAFLLPGLWLLFARSVVEVHPAEGFVSEMRDYVLWRKTKRHEISEVATLRGTHEVSQKRSSTTVETYRLDVILKGDGVKEFIAAQPATREHAQELGQLLAAKLGMPFQDLTSKRDSYGDSLRNRQGVDPSGYYRDEAITEENS
jgi:hypothetical protein